MTPTHQKKFSRLGWIWLHRRIWRHLFAFPIFTAQLLLKRLAFTITRKFVGGTLTSPLTGERIWCEITLNNYWTLHVVREFPDAVERELRLQLRPLIFDVGSNLGQFRDWVKLANPTMDYLSIDAREAFRPDVHCAVGERCDGIAFLPSHGMTAGLIHGGLKAIPAPRTTIDQIWRSRGSPKVYLLKVDIDGGEIHALRGARETLAVTTAVLVEMNDDVFAILKFAGFNRCESINAADFYFTKG